MRLGAPFAAGQHAPGRDPGIAARQAAALVNQATAIPAPDPAHRFDRTDAALARLESLIADTRAASPPDDGLVTRLRGDRVVALRHRERWLDVVGEVAALRQEGRPIPAYTRHAEADALLALRRPGEARAAYEDVLAAEPQSRNARVGLFFALLEQERVSDALALADAMASEGGPRMWRGVSPVPEPNADWLDAQAARGHSPLLRRRPPRGLAAAAAARGRRAGTLVPAIGESADCEARGWPRLADEETHIAATLTPPIHPPRSRSPRRRWRVSATTRPGGAPRRSSRSFPATRRWSGCAAACARTMPPSCAWTRSPAPSTATRPTSPGSGYDVRSALLAPPIDERWRLKAAYDFSQATQSRASSGGPAMARASRRTGPMRRSTRRSGSIREPSTARADACRHVGDWRPPAVGRRRERATRPIRRCARLSTASPPTAAPAVSATPGTRPRSPPQSCGAVVHRRQRPDRGERFSRGPRRGTA